MYTYINYYEKGPLEFYNDKKDMLPKPKKPQRPQRSKYENDEQWNERLKEWEANLPPDVEQEPKGNHITQKYYTEKLLPLYAAALHKARRNDLDGASWWFQDDNDPSYSTRSTRNLAYNFKQDNWMPLVIHPA
jgi:hypothetical protein